VSQITQSAPWLVFKRWVKAERKAHIESLVYQSEESEVSDFLRGRIRQLDDIMSLTDEDFENA
jgi:hypothetical protein